jgi:hypothetical protein
MRLVKPIAFVFGAFLVTTCVILTFDARRQPSPALSVCFQGYTSAWQDYAVLAVTNRDVCDLSFMSSEWMVLFTDGSPPIPGSCSLAGSRLRRGASCRAIVHAGPLVGRWRVVALAQRYTWKNWAADQLFHFRLLASLGVRWYESPQYLRSNWIEPQIAPPNKPLQATAAAPRS